MANNEGDLMVRATQMWLNKTYGDDSRFNKIPESSFGKTGRITINALTRALQIELGIQTTADNFGPTTQRLFQPISRQDGICKNIFGIVQGALWCKGYNTGHYAMLVDGEYLVDTTFDESVENAIKQLEEDAGRSNPKGIVDLNLMQALLSMNYYYSYNNSEKVQNIIRMQRYLNNRYENYIGLQPCDGIYGRGTNVALIYAIQAEENMATTVANGNFGPSTKKCLPLLPYSGGYQKNGVIHGLDYNGNRYSDEKIENFKILANIALYFNGFGSGQLTGEINIEAVKKFQSKYALSVTGTIDYATWLSLMTSCGDQERPAIACDCATIITEENIEVLKNNNFQYIGRYLSGTAGAGVNKGLSTKELQLLFNNGIRLFPIHQRSANYIEYFTQENAVKDARSAVENANALHLQFGAIIYFAIDCDATDEQITYTILPYFKILYAEVMIQSCGKYRVGIYGTRNVCSRICNAGFACSSFISDMSTGFSGNLGFTIPDNWALDQFATVTITSGNKSIEIDKDGFSGNYLGISHEYSVAESNFNDLNTNANSFVLVNRSGNSIPVYESKEHIDWPLPQSGTQYGVSGKIIGQIKPNEFYVFFGITNPSYDSIHKVLFNDGTDVRMGYIEGSPEYANLNGTDNINQANYDQRPPHQEPYSCFRYLPASDEYMLKSYEETQEITINKPVVYFNTYGNYEGMLNKGDKVIISAGNVNNTGVSRPWCYRSQVIKDGKLLDGSKYVSVGLEYGSYGKDRAWY